jgi:hypothetical protein
MNEPEFEDCCFDGEPCADRTVCYSQPERCTRAADPTPDVVPHIMLTLDEQNAIMDKNDADAVEAALDELSSCGCAIVPCTCGVKANVATLRTALAQKDTELERLRAITGLPMTDDEKRDLLNDAVAYRWFSLGRTDAEQRITKERKADEYVSEKEIERLRADTDEWKQVALGFGRSQQEALARAERAERLVAIADEMYDILSHSAGANNVTLRYKTAREATEVE